MEEGREILRGERLRKGGDGKKDEKEGGREGRVKWVGEGERKGLGERERKV